jgi:hypothetical protein
MRHLLAIIALVALAPIVVAKTIVVSPSSGNSAFVRKIFLSSVNLHPPRCYAYTNMQSFELPFCETVGKELRLFSAFVLNGFPQTRRVP